MKHTTAPVHYTTSQARCMHSTASWFSQTYVGFGRVRWRLWLGDVQDVQELQKKKWLQELQKKKWLQEMKKQETEKKQPGWSLWKDNTSKHCYSCKILMAVIPCWDGGWILLSRLYQIITVFLLFPYQSNIMRYQAGENSVYSISDQKMALL